MGEIRYHLDECGSCSHRDSCKYAQLIDRLISGGTLPLDLSNASCDEYDPDDSAIDEGWINYISDEDEDEVETVSSLDELTDNEIMYALAEQIYFYVSQYPTMEVVVSMNPRLLDRISAMGSVGDDKEVSLIVINGIEAHIVVDSDIPEHEFYIRGVQDGE